MVNPLEKLRKHRDELPNLREDLPEDFPLEIFSEASQDILQHFGADAPKILNEYATDIEDALITVCQAYKELKAAFDKQMIYKNSTKNDK